MPEYKPLYNPPKERKTLWSQLRPGEQAFMVTMLYVICLLILLYT